MKPKDVPAGFVEIAVEVFEDQAHEHCGEEEGCPGNTRTYHEALVRESLAEILPLHEKQLRAEVERLQAELAEAKGAQEARQAHTGHVMRLLDETRKLVEEAEAERDALKAAIEKLRTLCDKYGQGRLVDRFPIFALRHILAALDAPETTETPTPERRRELLRELTQQAIEAGTYGEPAPEMRTAPETPESGDWLKQVADMSLAAAREKFGPTFAPETPGDAETEGRDG